MTNEFLIIEDVVTSGEGIGIKEFRSKCSTRKRKYVFARQMIMTIATEMINEMSYAEAGSYYGKDHATVNHARKTISNLCQTDTEIMLKYKDYEGRCKVALNRDKDIKSEIIDKMYSKFPPEITVRTDGGITIIYQLVKIDGNIIAKVKD